ncbi:DUF115 domain-containing protein, partial [Nitrosopumilus sp.]|nr:DUF115 domain-containing protein [Nitrosopumilus sp.]
SAKKLVVNTVSDNAIVIGRGPSLKNHDHLNKLKNSNYNGAIICTDGALITALKAGITPDRFPEFYVVTVDPRTETIKFYNDKIISEYNGKIKGVFSTVSNPDTVKKARESGIEIFWFHSLVDYNEGEKSFNQISALMTRAKNHENGLPAIQTGGNVGTSSWFLGWKILNCKTITLIGINHGWEDTDSWDTIMTHNGMCKMIEMDKNSESFKKLFPRVYNPDFDCYCILDPIFQYYSAGLKEFIFRSPQDIKTINSTEGGCIFGDRIESMKLDEFLIKFD